MGSPRTILIVDDDADVACVMALLLEQQGYAVAQVTAPAVGSDWLTAVKEELAKAPIDIMLLDTQLPNGYGPDIAKALQTERESGGVSVPPIVLMSANSSVASTAGQLILAKSIVGFLAKPATAKTLYAVVSRALPREEEAFRAGAIR